jgi:hypothetical protein
MNRFNHISERWFWGALLALSLACVAYRVATDPGPRPTEYIGRTDPPVVDFDALSLDGATRLNGQVVTVAFTVGTPAYTWPVHDTLRTIVGPPDRGDVAEWTVALRGDRVADLDDGGEVRVKGVLCVIHHDVAAVDGVLVPAWMEVRVTEA